MRTAADEVLRCSSCQIDKPAIAFSFSDRGRGTLNFYCRACQAAYRRTHYLANKPDYVRRAAIEVRRRRNENRREVVRYLKTHPCIDCGRTEPVALEFDHRVPELKINDVSTMMMSKRWPRVLAEIEKCDVRCSNCHRRRTAVQFRWSKARRRDKL